MEFLKLLASTTILASLAHPGGLAHADQPKEILVEWNSTAKVSPVGNHLKIPGVNRVSSFQTPLMRRENKGFIERVSVGNSADLESVIDKYKKVPGVKSVEINYPVSINEVSNDPLYVNGSLWGMYSDDSNPVGPSGTTNNFGSQAEQVWGSGALGSTTTVIGVIDTGIDYTHPDLYLNIYLNQGEIKTLSFYNSLSDIDSDGIITFRDLNHPSNSSFVTDVNLNSRIEAGDLLSDTRWENGVDNDTNGYVDDLVGWDFINGDNDPFDDNYHGTHVAGTIAGIGGNSTGVAGVNWKTQLMPLKFLGAGGSGWISDAIQAVDYYTSATQDQDKTFNNTSVLKFVATNNSWGGGGYSSLLKTAIDSGALVNNHFVAAAGNSASNNDSVASYPSNYSTVAVAGWEAVTAVASLTSSGSLSSFSSYGATTVDLGAPGSDVISALPGSSYGPLSGTSMATPHVAGAIALYASSFPQANRRELREVVLSKARPTPSLNGKTATNGRLDIVAGFNELSTRYPTNTPSFSVSGPSSVNEGSSVSLSITTTNVSDGTTLYWSLTGVQSADVVSGSLVGSTTISSNFGNATFSLVNDNLLEGEETALFGLFSNSARTTQVASKSITINDTSNNLTYVWGTTGIDNLSGGNNPNVITGVPSTGVSPASLGRGQIDIVYGRGGRDFFLLGQSREGQSRIFYNNGSLSSVGSSDYLQIMDFNKLLDKIQMPTGRYFSRNASTNTVIYWDRNNNGSLNLSGNNRDEVIAIVRNVNLGNLTLTQGSVPWVIMTN